MTNKTHKNPFINIVYGKILVLLILLICWTIPALSQENLPDSIKVIMESAEQGDSDAQIQLAGLYLKGEGVEQNDEEAIKWLTMAAEQGNEDAQEILDFSHFFGDAQNLSEFLKLFAKAAKQENPKEWLTNTAEQGNEVAQIFLSLLYIGNDEIDDGIKWLTKAAEQDNAIAQYILGLCYYDGEGVDQDKDKGILLLKKAAEQGDEDAIEKLKEIE